MGLGLWLRLGFRLGLGLDPGSKFGIHLVYEIDRGVNVAGASVVQSIKELWHCMYNIPSTCISEEKYLV